MIRLVLGLVLLFLALSVATVLLVHAIRKGRRSRTGLARTSHGSRTHAGNESTYWSTKLAPDATTVVTRTSGRLPDTVQSVPALQCWTVDYTRPAANVEEWAPIHPLGWRVVKVDAIHYAVSSKCPAEVQRYSPSMLGWVKEEDLGAWGEEVWASIQLPLTDQA